MKQNINQILKEVLKRVNPSKEDLDSINKFLKNFINEFEKKLKEKKIAAQVFVGGSFAKKTLIKKKLYDVDVFIRFDKKYGNEISNLTKKILSEIKTGKISLIHGSRDYFRIEGTGNFFIEVVPVIKVKNPKEAENITDLSYFHVDYIKKKLKTEKMLEEVRLAKAFCHANKCYGAESYINGFSGYALELLVCHYKSFLNLAKNISKIAGSQKSAKFNSSSVQSTKEIIDLEKLYKNKNEILMNMNGAKMASPIVIIDPTFKERNALAALSKETFEQFQEVCRKFLKKPSIEDFSQEKTDYKKLKKNALKNKFEFILIKAKTDKQEGDIAGSKLVKFYRHLSDEMKLFYEIKNKGFDYDDKKGAEYFFVVKSKKEIIQMGPMTNNKEACAAFRKKHKNIFEKKDRIYSKEKIYFDVEEFIDNWKLKNSEKINEMGITGLEIKN